MSRTLTSSQPWRRHAPSSPNIAAGRGSARWWLAAALASSIAAWGGNKAYAGVAVSNSDMAATSLSSAALPSATGTSSISAGEVTGNGFSGSAPGLAGPYQVSAASSVGEPGDASNSQAGSTSSAISGPAMSGQWLTFWQSEPQETSWDSSSLPSSGSEDQGEVGTSPAANSARPLLIPLPTAWSAGLVGLIGLAGVAAWRQVRRATH